MNDIKASNQIQDMVMKGTKSGELIKIIIPLDAVKSERETMAAFCKRVGIYSKCKAA